MASEPLLMPYPIPIATRIHEATKAYFATPMKLSFGCSSRRSPWPVPKFLNRSKIRRVTTNAVNILAQMPTVRVTPKPFTGPVPMVIRITETISVVRLASMIVPNALL